MKNMHRVFAATSVAFFIACAPALAQWQTPDHTVPIGRGSGTGFKFAVPGTAGIPFTSNGASSDPSFTPMSLTAGVTGILPGANGGTNNGFMQFTGPASPLKTFTLPNASSIIATTGGANIPTIAQGDLLFGSAVNVLSVLAKDTNATRYLSNTGGSNNPIWDRINLANGVTGILPVANGGTSQSTAAGARSVSGINVESFTGRGDSNYTILATDKVVGTNAAFTASRTWTLPAANAVNAGQPLTVADFQGTVTGSNTLVISRAGSDTINGATSVTINAANGAYALWSDGISKWTAQAIGSAGAAGVTSFNGRSGAVVPVAGDYTVPLGGTGSINLTNLMSGLQPHKLVNNYEIAVNPGFWASYNGTKTNFTTDVLQANLNTATCNFAVSPALGCMLSGAMSPANTDTDGTEVWLYLIERISDRKPMLVATSSETFGSSQTFTATATTPGIITTPAPHGFRKRMTVRVSNSGGALPAPLGSGINYYVCTVPSATTFSIATSIASVNSGGCLPFSTTGSGTNTVVNGVVFEIDAAFGAGVAEVSRAIQSLTFVWSVGIWGGIPDMSQPPNSQDVLLTGAASSAAYRILNAGTATTFTGIDLSPWLSNGNRRIRLTSSCANVGSQGLCIVRPPGVGGGLTIGGPNAAGQADLNNFEIGTDSTTRIEYLVTGGAQLTMFIQGWSQMEQR